MVKRLGGWQVWVEIHRGHVIKLPKSKEEIREKVRKFVEWQKKPLSEVDILTDRAIKDLEYSTRILKKSGVPKRFIGEAEFREDGSIWQKRGIELKENFRKLIKQNKINKAKKIIQRLFELIMALWAYGIHEKTFKFFSNYGEFEDKLFLLDFLEVTGNKKKVEKQLRKVKWNKPDNIKEVLGDELTNYFVKCGKKYLTVDNLNKHWKKKLISNR